MNTFRKIIAAVLICTAVVTAVGAVPGLAGSVAFACQPDDPGCDG